MSRDHAAQYARVADMYAEHRCDCRHLVYLDDKPGGRCRWNYVGMCPCVDHRTPAQRAEQNAAQTEAGKS